MLTSLHIARFVIGFANVFAIEDDGVGTGGDGTTPPHGNATGSTTTDDGDGAGDNNDGDSGGSNGKTFTQAEVDALIDKRIARERSKLESDLKTMKDRSDMDEVDRLKAELADRDKALEAKDAANLSGRVETRAERLAIAAGVNPKRVDRFMRLLDLTDLDSLATDGKPDDDAIKALVDAELDATPEFKGAASGATSTPTGADFTGAGGTPKVWTREAIDKLSVEEFEKHEAEITAQMRAGKVK